MPRVGRYRKVQKTVWLVRCLGPAEVPEHHFYSEDKLRERICSRCRERIRALTLSPRQMFPSHAQEDH